MIIEPTDEIYVLLMPCGQGDTEYNKSLCD